MLNPYSLPFLEIGDTISEALADILFYVSDSLYSLLERAGLSIDMLLGSVDDASSQSFFSLGKGNIYGIIGARLFVATRNIFLILIGVAFMSSLVRAAVSPGPAKKIAAKAALENTALALLFVAWIPTILQFFVSLRGFFLRTVVGFMGVSNGDLYDVFVGESDDLTGAILLLGFVCCGIYFAFYYIAIAILQTVMLGILPIIALQSSSDTRRLEGWLQTFLGWMLIPMVDFVLFLVPVGLCELDANALVVLISMIALLPSRKFAFNKLGIEGDVAGFIAEKTKGAFEAAGKKAIDKVKETHKANAENREANKADKDSESLERDLARVDSDGPNGTADFRSGGVQDGGGDAPSSSGTSGTSGGEMSRPEDGQPIDRDDSSLNGADGERTSAALDVGGRVDDAGETISASAGRSDSDGRDSYAANRQSGADSSYNGHNPLVDRVYQKHANVDNFDRDGYKNHLTHGQKADFYQQRRKERLPHLNNALNIGKAVGGSIGGFSGAFAESMAGGNARTGAEIGSAVGSGAIDMAGPAVRFVGSRVMAFGADSFSRAKRAGEEWGAIKQRMQPGTYADDAGIVAEGSPIDAEPFVFDSAENGPVDYAAIADSALPESDFASGQEAMQWVSGTFQNQDSINAVNGIGSDLTEAVAYNDMSISVLDMFAGAEVANGMISPEMGGMNFSNAYSDQTSPNLMYGAVGASQVAASYLRNSDGSAVSTDAQALREEREKIQEAARTAKSHTSVVNGKFVFERWSNEELTKNREVLQRFAQMKQDVAGYQTGFAYLTEAKNQMREQNHGESPMISYRHTRTDRSGNETVAGRKFYNPVSHKVLNRKADESQVKRANSLSGFFSDDGGNQ